MSPEQEKFLNDCPAWARKLGVESLPEWQVILSLASLGWPDRFDRIHRLSWLTEHVLREWDGMSEKPDAGQIS